MRKIYAFLLLLLMPMLAIAQTNLAIVGTGPTASNYTSHQRIRVPVEAAGIVRLTQENLANKEATATDYSIGMWFNLSKFYQNSGWAYNDNKTILADLGTHGNSNANGNWVLCVDNSGTLRTQGHGGGDQHGIGSVGANNNAITTITLNEWHYLLFIVDNTNLKLQIYLDGTKVQDSNMSKVMIYDWDDDYDLHFAGLGFTGSLDEIQLYNKALTEEEVAIAQVNANAISSLTGLYTFDEEESTGTFANKASHGDASYKAVYNIESGSFYSDGGLVPVNSSTPTTPVLAMGREIPATEVTITLNQPAEGGTFSVSDGTTDHTETFTTMTGTELTLSATPADGYSLVGYYTVEGTTETEITGNTYIPTADATLTAHFTADLYTLTVANEQNLPYTLTHNGEEVTDLTAMLGGGAEYTLTLTVPDDKVLNAVRLGETELTGTDGVYKFTMDANATLTIDARAKAQYTVTINQPTGGTISATNNGTAVTSGDKVLEGSVLTLGNTPDSGYKFVNYTVTGGTLEGENVTVNSDITITGEFEEGIDYCIPTCANPGNPNRTTTSSNRGAKGLTISADGATTVTFMPHSSYTTRNVYVDGTSSAILVTDPGKTVTVSVSGTGSWMNGFIYADWDLNGFTYDDLATHNYAGDSGMNNIATTFRFTVPENLAGGDYRVRYILDWLNEDPCKFGETKKTQDNGEAVFDFLIRIIPQEYEQERTITVASADETLGTVAITNPATEGNSVTTKLKNVTVEATPAEGAAFMNWTNAAGDVVSTEATYTYTGEEDATLTANFGYMLNVTVAAGGSVSITADGTPVNNGVVIAPNSQIELTVTAPEGKTTVINVNGTDTVLDNNVYSFELTENTDVNITFEDKILTLEIVVVGNGTVECWSSTPDDGETKEGTQYQNGDRIIYGTDINFWAKPGTKASGDPEELTAVTLNMGGATTELSVGDDIWEVGSEGEYYMPQTVEDSIIITFTFSDDTQGIDEIGIDPANGPVEYYNLQGIRVDAENLVPGFYIVRQGSTAKKVLIQK